MQSNQSSFQPDSIVQAVVKRFVDRAEFGHKKYGTDLDRTDLSIEDWIQHAQDELHDGILYLEKLKETLKEFRKVGNI
jgi:hypothetical protein